MDLLLKEQNNMTKTDKKKFAEEWIASWNSHDIDKILGHYSEDVEITSPMIKLAAEIDKGSLKGKSSVAAYWRAALKRIPDLHFELIDSTEGVDSIALYYRSVMNNMSIEVMFFDEEGKVNKILAHYSNLSQKTERTK